MLVFPGRDGVENVGKESRRVEEAEAEMSGEKGPEKGNAELTEPYVPKLVGS